MEKEKLIQAIQAIYTTSKGTKLTQDSLKPIASDIRIICNHFGITVNQAILLCVIFSLSPRKTTDTQDLITHFRIEIAEILNHTEDFDTLVKKGLVYRLNSKPKNKQTILTDGYIITPTFVRCIIEGVQHANLAVKSCDTAIEFLERISEVGSENECWDECERVNPIQEFEGLLSGHSELSIVKRFRSLLNMHELFVLYSVIWQALNGTESNSLTAIIEKYFLRKNDRVTFVQKILHNDSALTKHNLVAIEHEAFFNSVNLRLTEKTIDIIKQEGIVIIHSVAINNKNIISPDSIKPKELYYNKEEQNQINQLTAILEQESFIHAQQKLIENNLPSGILAIVHGPSGTGKTQFVYQLARHTGRMILNVDLSELKSKWYGESEKQVKKIFDDYRAVKKDLDKAPILLLNEADAIIYSRSEGISKDNSSIQNTENIIQNVLLTEFENFDGILIATTNLVGNIDICYSRRFLLKIKLECPTVAVRRKIWASKLQTVTEEQLNKLSVYPLAGGSIDNIIRRHILNSVLMKKTEFANLIEYCKQEMFSFGQPTNPIGFRFFNKN